MASLTNLEFCDGIFDHLRALGFVHLRVPIELWMGRSSQHDVMRVIQVHKQETKVTRGEVIALVARCQNVTVTSGH